MFNDTKCYLTFCKVIQQYFLSMRISDTGHVIVLGSRLGFMLHFI